MIFLENGYCQGTMLNKWIESDNDEILDQLIAINKGTPTDSEDTYKFYRTIKDKYPEIKF